MAKNKKAAEAVSTQDNHVGVDVGFSGFKEDFKKSKSNVFGLSFLILRGERQYISFADYLKYINSSELIKIKNDLDLNNYASIEAQLLLFKKYLSTDFKKNIY